MKTSAVGIVPQWQDEKIYHIQMNVVVNTFPLELFQQSMCGRDVERWGAQTSEQEDLSFG